LLPYINDPIEFNSTQIEEELNEENIEYDEYKNSTNDDEPYFNRDSDGLLLEFKPNFMPIMFEKESFSIICSVQGNIFKIDFFHFIKFKT
jgi:hypothetical protein